jgi:hypothetical protein
MIYNLPTAWTPECENENKMSTREPLHPILETASKLVDRGGRKSLAATRMSVSGYVIPYGVETYDG